MKSNIKLVVVALTTLALAGCVGNKTKSNVESVLTQQTAVLTKVAPVENVEVAQTVDFTTTLLPYKKTFITPQMALRIDEIRVDVGDHVKEGELVATLDRNQYNQTSAQLKNAKQNLARMRSVYEAGGVSRSQIDELET
ncbi:MAG: biotin/lipoyl-binding protein, partial [Tidjanibacter sp.]|nr:biotin/lipoyl-binding protein [Tidjanibacter sp.]